ncbi:hypothetical protein HID58_032821 [Brassica napus]|uniref:BHLH domain-containing protein n=1 Tax=Brassica napus TaxID=3708 RepID=A0ABQ8BXG5_BRANA|nr:transcription factor bHLH157-like [Brassica napus]KAH0909500.1 hypothetical protein HID58_032821 [Brassica napus]
MMDMEVKQILKSLCFSYGWSYAVYWRSDPINPMLLRVEETHNDEQSATLVDDMILKTHVLGQGIVGEAALTGNYQWLFSDTLVQCEHEFQNQFISGFTSIAIIPIGSSGVVQLGSTQKIVESREMLEETERALQEKHSLKVKDQSVDLDTLFESLVPLVDCELVPEYFQELSFDDIFTEEDNNPPSLLFDKPAFEASPNPSSSDINEDDDSVFDILNSYSLDDLYQLLADDDSQEQECSMVIQGNDKDLLGIHSYDCPQKGQLFSELISTRLSNSTSCLTNVQQEDSYSGLNQSKRRKLDNSTSSSFFMTQAETLTPLNPPMWIDEDMAGNWKKPQEEGVKKKKKRAKAGESRKPRPKDRQMIQDRIKELRGMIPNGAKCSIDTLLDLTIRHMVFMQSIAKYADKLKQPYQPKLVKEKERTWALEVGDDESVVCPIIVEDLKPQGQMQIEMVCQENGDEFLEIAHVVRGLGLNILKGVMVTRQGRIWAHLIVEAKPHITRRQLFYSLVHLFQQQNPPHSFDHQT